METVLYIKGPRMRSEMAGDFGMTTILQCDLKRTLTINEKQNLHDHAYRQLKHFSRSVAAGASIHLCRLDAAAWEWST